MALAPEPGGRWATDAFSVTRGLTPIPDNSLPLGARAFELSGCPRVRCGYLWPADGPIALLLHGWGVDSSSMLSLIAPLRDAGFAVAAFDAPGHGVSPGNQATMTEYVDAAAAVIGELGEVRVIVAHSLGAIAAASALSAHDPGVERIVLLAPTCTLAGVLERWQPDGLWRSRSAWNSIYAELHRRNGVPVGHWDVATLGSRLTCPILAIHDPDDDVVPFSETQAIAAALGDVRVLSAPGRGHAGILMASEVKRAVGEFVADRECAAVGGNAR
ncbi:MAG TPA: alpha/beta hydrolase [Solirubrobacteraceae bacterium]|jgi:pimeloyl-ACP methyl ester carboxylesterase|nr:alpha/beta hydrolase [Solirubrobacteraceae bacterium]